MNSFIRFSHQCFGSGKGYQRLNGSDVTQSGMSGINNPYNEPAPLAACRSGNFGLIESELLKDSSIASRDFLSGASGKMISLLLLAANAGHTDVVRLLIVHGADVNRPTEVGDTPLACAVEKGHLDVAALLVKHGADVNQAYIIWKGVGVTLLSYALILGHLDVAELLIKHGADVNRANRDGSTPLCFAASCGLMGQAELLIKQGADLNRYSWKGYGPLSFAAYGGHQEVVALLIKNGADVNWADRNGSTPLYLSARNGHKSTVELLLDAGADPKKKTRILGSLITISPRTAARFYARNKVISEMIKVAIKNRSVTSAHFSVVGHQYCPYGAI